VALANTSELLKNASSNVLRFKTDSSIPNDIARKARITGRIVQLSAPTALDVESHLAALRQAGVDMHDIEIRKADLEDVFLDVMQRQTAPEATA
jgi:ABC-2 type transport system ATP-binding protein